MSINITFASPDLVRARDALIRFARQGVPYAARFALNKSAFEARQEWQEQIEDSMTLRNTWTKRSIRVKKASGRNIRNMKAIVGSVAEYMATQEHGDTLQKQGKHGVSIPTSVSSGEGRGARPRRKRVRRPNRLRNIQLRHRPSGMKRKQRNAVAIRQAFAAGRKFVFLELERYQGIFRIAGRKRNPRLDLVWDLTQATVRIPATRTLEKTLGAIKSRLPDLHREAIQEQLRRHGVTRY